MMLPLKLPLKLGLLLLAILAAGILWHQTQLTVLALTQINPVPETQRLVNEERYADAASYLDFFLAYDYVQDNPEAQKLAADIAAFRHDPLYQAQKFADGIVEGTSDELIGQVAGVTTDFFVIGDLRDLAQQGTHWLRGEEVDDILTALAAIGVAASTAQVVSTVATAGSGGAAAPAVGASTAVKGGTIILKIARKLGKLPTWLTKLLPQAADTVKKTKKLDTVTDLFGDVYSLAKVKGGINLLEKTTDAASLKRVARVADTFGDQTVTLYRLGGDTFLDVAHKAKDLGTDTIKLAATYGQEGLRVLDKVGAINFVKYTARGSKMAYKGDVFQILARLLALLPQWLLAMLVALGAWVWLPWQALNRLSQGFRQRIVNAAD